MDFLNKLLSARARARQPGAFNEYQAEFIRGFVEDLPETADTIWALHGLVSIMEKQKYGWEDYADEHLLPPQRFASFVCLAAGRMPALSGWLRPLVNEQRLRKCPAEWERALAGTNTVLASRL